MFTRPELLGYVDHCRRRVRRTLDALTEDKAALPVPVAHRHHSMPYGVLVGSMPLHVVEHAAQIRQFLTAAGVRVHPMPGDRGYAGWWLGPHHVTASAPGRGSLDMADTGNPVL